MEKGCLLGVRINCFPVKLCWVQKEIGRTDTMLNYRSKVRFRFDSRWKFA